MVNPIQRTRLKFKDDYLYLGRNMVMEEHPDFIHEALLEKFKVEDLHQYPDMWHPYDVLSKYLGVEQNRLLITRGAEGAFKQVYETFNLTGKSVGIPLPTCAMYTVYADAYNVNVIPIKGKSPDYKLTVSYIKDIARQVDVLFLINPSSNLANFFKKEDLKEIIDFCSSIGVVVFLDEVYTGWEHESYLPYLERHDNLIISSSFSKIGFPSIKTGWLATSVDLKKRLESTRGAYELDYFCCKALEFIIDNVDYFRKLKRDLLNVKKEWIKRLTCNSNFTVYDSALYTIRLYSEDKKLVKDTFDKLYYNKIVVNVIDGTNLQFSVSRNKNVEKIIFDNIK